MGGLGPRRDRGLGDIREVPGRRALQRDRDRVRRRRRAHARLPRLAGGHRRRGTGCRRRGPPAGGRDLSQGAGGDAGGDGGGDRALRDDRPARRARPEPPRCPDGQPAGRSRRPARGGRHPRRCRRSRHGVPRAPHARRPAGDRRRAGARGRRGAVDPGRRRRLHRRRSHPGRRLHLEDCRPCVGRARAPCRPPGKPRGHRRHPPRGNRVRPSPLASADAAEPSSVRSSAAIWR